MYNIGTDIDRLHSVVQDEYHGRGSGRTFAACHNLAGILETCKEGATIAWIIPRMSWLYHIKPMLEGVLREHELLDLCEWPVQNELTCGTKRVRFIPRSMLERHIVSFHYDGFVDDFGELEDCEQEDRERVERAQRWYKLGLQETIE